MLRPPLLFRSAPATRRKPAQAGASLIEVTIATLILGLLAVGLVEFFAKGMVWFDQEEHKRVATLLAQEAMERTVAKPYAQVAAWSETRKISFVRYAVAVSVQSNSPQPDMKTVRSVVTWRAAPSAQRTVSLATLVFDN